MSAATNFLEDAFLDHVLGVAEYTQPAGIYLALFLSAPGEDGSGTEVSGSGYAREEVTFTAASSGESANDAAVEFAASGDWGNVTHIAYFDAVTDGNMLFKGALADASNILSGDELIFPIGDLTISAD
jgi:hypothetical protein